ncbi:hypothetical protein DLAC_03528 [Tieghemostelium lacteum]|uniref:Uncharacterized protein n=1 Tax=Tieghemostelium lacteum TaxID=361077 RepID=A0A152A1D7_TIELA|nr:hypothetical protein DLAC_03528 [Tieghemostelium lacteum]|eukprot:KYR00030.1 hypothetical protein DLAC_03528 [Tieghemostelium lacteum]
MGNTFSCLPDNSGEVNSNNENSLSDKPIPIQAEDTPRTKIKAIDTFDFDDDDDFKPKNSNTTNSSSNNNNKLNVDSNKTNNINKSNISVEKQQQKPEDEEDEEDEEDSIEDSKDINKVETTTTTLVKEEKDLSNVPLSKPAKAAMKLGAKKPAFKPTLSPQEQLELQNKNAILLKDSTSSTSTSKLDSDVSSISTTATITTSEIKKDKFSMDDNNINPDEITDDWGGDDGLVLDNNILQVESGVVVGNQSEDEETQPQQQPIKQKAQPKPSIVWDDNDDEFQ